MTRDFAPVARWLASEHRAGAKSRTFAAEFGIGDLDAAYAAQAAFVDLLCARTQTRPAGYKIGLTSARMQAMCGLDRPLAGVVLADRIHPSGAIVAVETHGHLGIECEIAVRLGRDLTEPGAPFDRDSIAAAVEAVAPAFELVDDRHADYRALDALSLIADNSWSAGIVHGEFRRSWPDLEAVTGVLARNGKAIDKGEGRDVLGHPFVPLAWLANHLRALGGGLRRGDIVMTGSIVPTRFPTPGEAFRFELAGLGAVDVALA